MKSTSWQNSAKWYQENVGEEGHYYHRHVILPELLKKIPNDARLLDLACGQGVLGRQVPSSVIYEGLDIAPDLIKYAKNQDKSPQHSYGVQDVTKPFKLKKKFTHITVVLAIQNIDPLDALIKNVIDHLEPGGELLIVMNHPCFRIPRQSSWDVDPAKKIQYRRLDRYLTSLTIPIKTHPGKNDSVETLSFHRPLSEYVKALQKGGLAVIEMDEWISNKESTGPKAKMENRAREEFPLFLFIRARSLK